MLLVAAKKRRSFVKISKSLTENLRQYLCRQIRALYRVYAAFYRDSRVPKMAKNNPEYEKLRYL